jgi:phosphatidylglycerophosphatase B
MLALVWLAPIEFTACKPHSYWCHTAYWLTESAGKYGTLVIVMATGLIFALHARGAAGRIKAFLKVALVFIVLLSSFAYINEHITKTILKFPRPSHLFIVKAAHSDIDSLYKLKERPRQASLRQMIENTPALYETLDKKVQEHWIEESGYSFPSGHSFNAFLCGCLLAYCVMQGRFRKLYFLPLIWSVMIAVSRVAIGAHSALDVSVGGLLGVLVAWAFLSMDYTRRLLRVESYKSNTE